MYLIFGQENKDDAPVIPTGHAFRDESTAWSIAEYLETQYREAMFWVEWHPA